MNRYFRTMFSTVLCLFFFFLLASLTVNALGGIYDIVALISYILTIVEVNGKYGECLNGTKS